jgi:hypothetical protein
MHEYYQELMSPEGASYRDKAGGTVALRRINAQERRL